MAMSPFRQRLLLPLLLLSCPFLSLLLPLCFADPRTSQAALICGNATAPGSSRQAFISSFLAAMDGVTPQISSRRYARVVAGASANDTVYAFGQCMKDLSKSDCDLCFATSKTQILRCLPFQKTTRAGRNFLDGCYLRYDDYEFFGEALSGDDKFVCGAQAFAGNQTAFASNARELVQKLTAEAPSNGGFLVASIEQGNSSVYGLGQCWEFVNRSSCSRCLLNASAAIATCIPREEGRVLNAGCYMRYSTTRFYNNSGTDTTTSGGGNHRAIDLAAASSAVAAVMIAGLTLFFGKRKYAQKKKERKQLGALASTVRKSKINFKYETLERATDYFSHTNKLGQGGSGSVFKGLLSDGKAIAVKRLFFNTRQWVDQFFNEVNLISGMDHKNLVKLLGCSINGPESLLVYEFVPNKSLHHYLSDVENSKLLNWEMRFNIILGTAEGLAYLHEESSLRIIHRDIKLSNILLDENYHAKIADFGLARLFPEDRSHISTAIAGTLGYMAPEYIVRGKLTEKADVFSFGILVVELITGKRNNTSQDPLSALQMVWNLHSLHKLWEAVDPILEGKYPVEKASRALHIGLLCSQASPELRPAMSLVVKMLKDEDPIPEPTQPPFLCSSREIALAAAAKSSSPYRSSTHSSDNSTTITIVEPR